MIGLREVLAASRVEKRFVQGLLGFTLGSLAFLIAHLVFIRQDERNYGE